MLGSAADYSGISRAANMTSTVEDLAKFAVLQFRDGPPGGDEVLRGSALRENSARTGWIRIGRRAGAWASE